MHARLGLSRSWRSESRRTRAEQSSWDARWWRIRGVGGREPTWSCVSPHFRIVEHPSQVWQKRRQGSKRTPDNFEPQSPHLGTVPFFLMWRYRSWPPGVLTTRTLFERVLYLHDDCKIRIP